jgi:multiple sugar transport system permease protein
MSIQTDAEKKTIGWFSSKGKKKTSLTHSNFWGFFFIMPALIGLVVFYFGPMIFSLVISFFRWEVVVTPQFIGFENYKTMFLEDELVGKALTVTLYYTGLSVPLINVVSLFIASMLNARIHGKSVFRTISYIPSIVPAVASSALWMYLFNPTFGFFNTVLGWFDLDPQLWIYDTKLVIPSLALMGSVGRGQHGDHLPGRFAGRAEPFVRIG